VKSLLPLAILVVLIAAIHLALPMGSLVELHRRDTALATLLLTEIRLPRTLLALGYGAALGMTGAALQALFANPLASPDITGSSSGAALGAVLGGYFLSVTNPIALAGFGAAGAGIALLALLALACGAATSLMLALAPSPFAFYDSFDWLMGSFVDRSLPQAAAALIPAVVALLFLARLAKPLDILALGEDVAASLGYRPERLGVQVVALTAVAVGACVSVCGAIGFVGLIAPFAARRLSAGHPGRAMLPAALIGAVLLLLADLAVRLGPAGRIIPVGVITTAVGTPLFIWMVVGMRRRLTS